MAIVRKVVLPAAGLGTRFLPATKVVPKEMLALVDKPVIQYGVDEAVAAGIEHVIFVTSRGKNAIEDHFDISSELEAQLASRGKHDALSMVRSISSRASFSSVRQGEPLGLGHAVLAAREAVGNEPFAVLLPDDVIDADPPAIKQLMDVYERVKSPVIAVMRVPMDCVSSYGIIAPGADLGGGLFELKDMVEKPRQEDAPSNLIILGRYILTPDIFPALEATKSDRTGEIQLTNGIRALMKTRKVYALETTGVRHDTGNKLGFLKATAYFAMKSPDVAGEFVEYLASIGAVPPASKS